MIYRVPLKSFPNSMIYQNIVCHLHYFIALLLHTRKKNDTKFIKHLFKVKFQLDVSLFSYNSDASHDN